MTQNPIHTISRAWTDQAFIMCYIFQVHKQYIVVYHKKTWYVSVYYQLNLLDNLEYLESNVFANEVKQSLNLCIYKQIVGHFVPHDDRY